MNIAVIFAGGSGIRFGDINRPKQFFEIDGKPIIIRTLEIFEECQDIDQIVIACLEDWIFYLKKILVKYNINKVQAIVPGGITGQESIYNGLVAAKELTRGQNAIVLIHDGVRPVVDAELLSACVAGVNEFGSAITCTKVTETIVRIEEDCIHEAFPRSVVMTAKAPQGFWLFDILEAHEDARKKGKNDYIDSCSLMMQYKNNLHFIEGKNDNIKITDFEDIYTLRAIMKSRDDRLNYGWGE